MKKTDFLAAGYLRLSREDENSSESGSIQTQREMILSYIAEQEDVVLSGFYTDDGYSGLQYERPGFLQMMEDMYSGKINCIIVKDLSRLGRDYIQSGKLIQRVFPAMQVRFIAIADGYDSAFASVQESGFLLPLKNFMNDAYCRDISMKVRSQQQMKRKQGAFIGAFPVYGYRKSPENRNQLLIDKRAAEIVALIFMLKKDGWRIYHIAKLLNQKGILSPLAYKRQMEEHFQTGFQVHEHTDWSSTAVKRILTNEIYTGTMVQGKERRISYKVKKSIPNPPECWVRVEGTHEPIVSKQLFEEVQEMLKGACKNEK